MIRKANAVWSGSGRDGAGKLTTASGVLSDQTYGYRSRFEDGPGTNPEELVAAAHAACFSMALSLFMANEGLTPESIDTSAEVTFEKVGEAWTVTSSHLKTNVKSPNADPAKFQKAAEGAKAGCPISRLLNTKITLDAKLA